MIVSYELEQFYPTIDSINKLGIVLNTNLLCSEGYSKFLLKSYNFKNTLSNCRNKNNLTKRAASKLFGLSEIRYNS